MCKKTITTYNTLQIMRTLLTLAFALATFVGCNEFVPADYTETVETGGKIEAAYLKMGKEETAFLQVSTDEAGIGAYAIVYPKSLTAPKAMPLPVVIFANGTGVTASKYPALFQHLASWGFIVVGNEDGSSGNGNSSDKTLAFLIKQNEDNTSVLYHKVDMQNIGISGHSQGGAGVFNAITDAQYGKYYKTAVVLSPTHEEIAGGFGWPYNTAQVKIPTLMLAGTNGDFETKLVIPIEKMRDMYSKLAGMKLMARKKNCEHGQMLYSADGYVTAWFMWQLKNDKQAAKAFVGNKAEIKTNPLYQDVQDALK